MQRDKLSGKILITGRGMLGTAWHLMLSSRGIGHQVLERSVLDISDQDAVETIIREGTALVVNTAAFTDVDGAETKPDLARLVNSTAVGFLAQRCQQVSATLIHYSTDYVFGGLAKHPYPVSTPHDPINVYGHSKAAGETQVWNLSEDHLVIRTSWLYASWGDNFVRTMLQVLRNTPEVSVVADQRGRPTSALHLAEASWELFLQGSRGTFHVCDEGDCTWYDFAQEISRLCNAKVQIQACGTDAFPRPAPRPAYSVLDLSQTTERIGPLSEWQCNLAQVIREFPP